MRSRWPRGLRIHPANNALLELPDSHPAKMTIIAHAECCRDCVGKEIVWPDREHQAFEQSWHSDLMGRGFSFSSYAYAFLSFDLILEEWLSRPSHVTKGERAVLSAVPMQEMLLDECERVATENANSQVLGRLPQIRRFNALRLESIENRLDVDGLEAPPPIEGAPADVLGLQFRGG